MQEWLSRLAAGYSASPMRSPGPMWARGTTAIALTLTCGGHVLRSPSVLHHTPQPEARLDRKGA